MLTYVLHVLLALTSPRMATVQACEQIVVDRCVDSAASDGSTDCEDDALWFAFELECGAVEFAEDCGE